MPPMLIAAGLPDRRLIARQMPPLALHALTAGRFAAISRLRQLSFLGHDV